MQIKLMDITKLKPFDKNPREKHEVDGILKSIEKFGWTQPIVIDEKFRIAAGHGRYQAAMQGNIKEVPVIQKKFTDALFKAYVLADNKLGEKSKWKHDLVSELMLEIDNADKEILKHTAFSDAELEEYLDTKDIDDLMEDEGPVDKDNKGGTPPKKNHVKMVQLFLNDTTMPLFLERIEVLQSELQQENVTDTVYKAVEIIYEEVMAANK